ncbi:hypothetical protein BDK51DRAFT_36990, partial [Blyttiomyces helicus]
MASPPAKSPSTLEYSPASEETLQEHVKAGAPLEMGISQGEGIAACWMLLRTFRAVKEVAFWKLGIGASISLVFVVSVSLPTHSLLFSVAPSANVYTRVTSHATSTPQPPRSRRPRSLSAGPEFRTESVPLAGVTGRVREGPSAKPRSVLPETIWKPPVPLSGRTDSGLGRAVAVGAAPIAGFFSMHGGGASAVGVGVHGVGVGEHGAGTGGGMQLSPLMTHRMSHTASSTLGLAYHPKPKLKPQKDKTEPNGSQELISMLKESLRHARRRTLSACADHGEKTDLDAHTRTVPALAAALHPANAPVAEATRPQTAPAALAAPGGLVSRRLSMSPKAAVMGLIREHGPVAAPSPDPQPSSHSPTPPRGRSTPRSRRQSRDEPDEHGPNGSLDPARRAAAAVPLVTVSDESNSVERVEGASRVGGPNSTRRARSASSDTREADA